MLSEKKKASNAAYNKKCDTIQLRPRLEEGQQIRQAAQDAGESLQGYILQACRDRMQADKNK